MNNYIEVSRGSITDNRCLVVSKFSDSSYTIGQTLEVEENNKLTSVFMKGAIHINDLDGLYKVKQIIDNAIEKIEDEIVQDIKWDE